MPRSLSVARVVGRPHVGRDIDQQRMSFSRGKLATDTVAVKSDVLNFQLDFYPKRILAFELSSEHSLLWGFLLSMKLSHY